MTCPDEDTLLALATGRLSDGLRGAAEAHLDGCAPCRQALAFGLESSASSWNEVDDAKTALGPGTRLGRLVVVDLIGEGATGKVVSAWDPLLNRRVAVKVVRAADSRPGTATWLLREAQTLAQVSHPNIVTVFDVGEWRGSTFIALEYLSGGSLREWLASGKHSWPDVVRRFIDAGRGLAAAHRVGVVHRDVKPENLLLTQDGRVQVSDFGLALLRSSAEGTPAGCGTPAYMPLAQLEGAPSDAASDQFSFAVSLFEALTGSRPWEARSLRELKASMRAGSAVFPRGLGVPSRVRQAVVRGLSLDEAARWASMNEFVAELESSLRPGRPVTIAVGAVIAGLLLTVLAARNARHVEVCIEGERRLRAEWQPTHRAALLAQFAAAGLPWAPTTFEVVARAFDARAETYSSQYREACLASMLAPTGRDEARMACAEKRMAELGAVRSVLEAAGRAGVLRSAELLDRLPAPSACLDAEAPDPEDDAVHRQLRLTAAKAEALDALGQYSEAERLTRPASSETTASEQTALWTVRGRSLMQLGRISEARSVLEQAVYAATERRDAEAASLAASQLAHLVAFHERRIDDARRWASLAKAWLPNSSVSRSAEAYEVALAMIERRRGALESAVQHLRRAFELTVTRAGADSMQTIGLTVDLATVLAMTGHGEEALSLLDTAWVRFGAAYGEQHPACSHVQNSLAILLAEQGQLEEALVRFQLVYASYLATYGAPHPSLAWAAGNLGFTSERTGKLHEALRWYEVSRAHWAEAVPDSPLSRVPALAGIARTAIETDDDQRALAAAQEVLELCVEAVCEPLDEGTATLSQLRVLIRRNAKPPALQPLEGRARAAFVRAGPRGAAGLEQLAQLLKRR